MGPSSTQTGFYLSILQVLAYESSPSGGAADEGTVKANNTQRGGERLTCESKHGKRQCDRGVQPLTGSTEDNVEQPAGAG